MLGMPYNFLKITFWSKFVKEKLTSSLEDYLEVICNYIDANKVVRAIDISKELNVSRASVTEALKKLAGKKLLIYDRYGSITMTEEGLKEARNVVVRHTTLQKFFEEIIGLDKIEASQNACRVEHVISEQAFNKIVEFVDKYLQDNK